MSDSCKLLEPTFLNWRDGYRIRHVRNERWGLFWDVAIYEFTLSETDPLMFRDRDGLLWMPDRHEDETDLGSVPPPLRGIFAHDTFSLSYLFHDSAEKHGGLWVTHPSAAHAVFAPLTIIQRDRMLRNEWIPAETTLKGGATWKRNLIWAGVTLALPVRWLAARRRKHKENQP